MNNLVGVYGGTFDPTTYGHWQSIKKACAIFDRLYIVVATAEGKAPMFDKIKRADLLSSTIPEDYLREDGQTPQIVIKLLPEGVYLATYAKRLGANFLVRGIRDEFDFHYEHQIYQTNRHIEPSVETIYLMPDKDMSLVSSSWVKGLVGHYGWRQAIKPFVSETTLTSLALIYAKKRFVNINKHWLFGLTNNSQSLDKVWEDLFIDGMNKHSYHNVYHILDCLEAMDLYWGQDPVMEYAIWKHDVVPSVDESASIASVSLRYAEGSVKDMVVRLINATKHDKCKYETVQEEVMVSIDLLPLGYDPIHYEVYRSQVYAEYKSKSGMKDEDFYKEWVKGRAAFLRGMLSRDFIYPWEKIRNEFELQAKTNMGAELQSLGNKS